MTAVTDRASSCIHTYTGRFVNPLDLQVEDVDIADIAHALANQCRFSGHVKEFFSVAQHSVICSFIVEPGFELAALLHDAQEAYLQDMARPLKIDPHFGQAYRGAEKRAEKVIAEVFGTPYPMPPEVKWADNTCLVTEARDLMHGTDDWSPELRTYEPLPDPIVSWSPKKARTKFLERYLALIKE
jgi:5'-nucleotidase